MVGEWGKEPSNGPFMGFITKDCCGQEKGGKDRKAKWNGRGTPPLPNWPGPCPSCGMGPSPLYQVENKAIMSLCFGM